MTTPDVTYRGPAPARPSRLPRAWVVGLFVAAVVAVAWWALREWVK